MPIVFADDLRSLGTALGGFLACSAVERLARALASEDSADARILCYHAVEESEASAIPSGADVHPRFAQQTAWLAKQGFRAVSLDASACRRRRRYGSSRSPDDVTGRWRSTPCPALATRLRRQRVRRGEARGGTSSWDEEGPRQRPRLG
jgi:hypothetical protein